MKIAAWCFAFLFLASGPTSDCPAGMTCSKWGEPGLPPAADVGTTDITAGNLLVYDGSDIITISGEGVTSSGDCATVQFALVYRGNYDQSRVACFSSTDAAEEWLDKSDDVQFVFGLFKRDSDVSVEQRTVKTYKQVEEARTEWRIRK